MLKRLIPLLLAVVVGATPIAREICQISCAEAEVASATSPHAHRHAGHSTATHGMPGHDMGTAAAGLNLSAVPAAPTDCGSADAWQAASLPVAKVATSAPAVVPQLADPASPIIREVPFASVDAIAFVLLAISLRTPLRV